jgi:hypothetical protein
VNHYTTVNAVVFVSNASSRFDRQTQSTFQYYLDLLAGVINPVNLVFLDTHCPSESFEADLDVAGELETISTWIVRRKQEVVGKFKEVFHMDLYNYNILNIEPDALNAAEERFQRTGKFTVFDYTLRMRSEILRTIYECDPVFLHSSHFSLPPLIDSVFQRALMQLDIHRATAIQSTVSEEDIEHVQAKYRTLENLIGKRDACGKRLMDLTKNSAYIVRSDTVVTSKGLLKSRAHLTVKRSDIESYFRRTLGSVPTQYHVEAVFYSDASDIREEFTADAFHVKFRPGDFFCTYSIHVHVNGSIANADAIRSVQKELKNVERDIKLIHHELSSKVRNPKVDAISKFLDKYGYVSPSDSDDSEESKKTYFLKEIEEILEIFQNPKNKLNVRTHTLSVAIDVTPSASLICGLLSHGKSLGKLVYFSFQKRILSS